MTLAGAYPDWSAFSDAALSIWANEEELESGELNVPEAVDAVADAIEGTLEMPVGGWPMEEELGQTGQHTDADARRGLENFWSILRAARANVDEIETDEAPPQVPRQQDVIHLTVRRGCQS